MKKFVYDFMEGSMDLKPLLGGKGANLAEMTRIGLPVPSGFTVTTEACNEYYVKNTVLWDELKQEIFQHLSYLEESSGKRFGDIHNPLLVSVRSGSVFSMPGMMDTILNLGLNDESVEGLAKVTNNERFAYDSYRRFIQMFGDVVLHIGKYKFDTVLEKRKQEKQVENDIDLTSEDLKFLTDEFKKIIEREVKHKFPQDVKQQLLMAIEAVFKSWNNPRAKVYRRINDIPDHLGTAVTIQMMVFGNMGETSGTGVAFTRNPSNGEKKLFGEFLMNAQGEDVVAGIRTPQEIQALNEKMPDAYNKFIELCELLEKHYMDMQDIEFTIERGELYILQTRNGKRTTNAAINIAVDMVDEGLISKKEAIMRVDPQQLDQLLHPTFDEEDLKNAEVITRGLPASSGASYGKIYFSPEDVVKANSSGEKAILVRHETSPEDIEGMVASVGILTARGGMTSHAAVVARGMGKCCVAGAGEVKIDEASRIFKVRDQVFHEGDYISLNGNTGDVYSGEIKTENPQLTGNFQIFMGWADQYRRLKIRTNADTPRDTKQALEFGAEGIGLCRTEHMFFDDTRIPVVRRMILSRTIEQRKKALDLLLPMQRQDFKEIFEAMGEKPVTIRLLDPPLHEFLPHEEEDIRALAKGMEISYQQIKEVVSDLKEFNPMLGHRGCRLAITYPEIYQMQVQAIIEAAVELKKEKGLEVVPEIMVPLVGELKELQYVKDIITKTVDEIIEDSGVDIKYLVGTMIEVPRAAITADEIAKDAEFFSFGTNDLTQMTYGFSRDDAGAFIKEYVDKNILEKDPFQRIDRDGVGKLMEIAVDLGKKTRADLKIGICGEHGGEPNSVEFCHMLNLDYVSCSPYRVPIARLAAAQAAINNKDKLK
ncbi:pyruvate, phosphate dikinase [Alkaliphilus peptidifermentans]|uniref:Pyruvate, phosphate dikinase n=1 Tax=Alkaliphilus peptidifermentans DSM 18978 TaxID=1120976 RepID=A0A1G5BT56_9FIRM|nr:pyruvate, phosphate dikinase [Alkaliphilus peptidifermentans]SCX93372.1 pyruvate phosphate dikinase [Alkaliphilus peptidifermentans DSM 18978]